MIGSGTPVDAAFVAAAPKLRIVASYSVGYDNVDLKALAARDIVLTNSRGALDEAVADLTYALVIIGLRRLGLGSAGCATAAGRRRHAVRQGPRRRHARPRRLRRDRPSRRAPRPRQRDARDLLQPQRRERDDLRREDRGRRRNRGRIPRLRRTARRGGRRRRLHSADAADARDVRRCRLRQDEADGDLRERRARRRRRHPSAAARARPEEDRRRGAGRHRPGATTARSPLADRDDVVVLPHIGSATNETRARMAMVAAQNLVAFAQGKPLLTRVE